MIDEAEKERMGVVWGEDGSACQQSHTQDIHGNVCVEFWRHWRTHAIILTDLNEQVLPEYCTSLYACNTISHSHTQMHTHPRFMSSAECFPQLPGGSETEGDCTGHSVADCQWETHLPLHFFFISYLFLI